MDRTEYLYQKAGAWICDMLLNNEIRLKDVPEEIRTSKNSIYGTALRISRNISCHRLIQDLTILSTDIYNLGKGFFGRETLLRTLLSSIQMYEDMWKEEIDDFKKTMPESLLREMYGKDRAVGTRIRGELV